MTEDELRERWWTPTGRQLASEVFRFLRGERPLPPEIDFHEGLADLRGVGVPPPDPARSSRGKVDYGPVGLPTFQVEDVHWDQLDLSHAWLPRMRARRLHSTACRFDHANCRSWRLESTTVNDASFTGADFWRASLMGWNQDDGNVWTGCIFDYARMTDLDLTGGHLLGCTFEQTPLDGSLFLQVEIRNCIFSGSLKKVVFDGRRGARADAVPPMLAVDFSEADICDAQFLGYRFRRVLLPPGIRQVDDYPAVVAEADESLAALGSPQAETLRDLLRPALKDEYEPDSVGVFDRRVYEAHGGEPLAALAERYVLGSTKESRSRRIHIETTGFASEPGGAVVSKLIAAGQWSPPGVDASERLDLVAKSPFGEATLIMVETRPWDADPSQRDQLASKITTYCEYLLEGHLPREYPGLAGRPVVLRLECATEPPPEIQEVIQLAARHLALQDIGFELQVDPSLAASE